MEVAVAVTVVAVAVVAVAVAVVAVVVAVVTTAITALLGLYLIIIIIIIIAEAVIVLLTPLYLLLGMRRIMTVHPMLKYLLIALKFGYCTSWNWKEGSIMSAEQPIVSTRGSMSIVTGRVHIGLKSINR